MSPATINRTKVELKLGKCLLFSDHFDYQSYQSGIETIYTHSGIKQIAHYQSYQSGIETSLLLSLPEIFLYPINRTKVELKHREPFFIHLRRSLSIVPKWN